MTGPWVDRMETTFDTVAQYYNAELQQGLRWSGESPDYFVQHRVSRLRDYCRRSHSPTDVVLDFGCGVGNAAATLARELAITQFIGIDPSIESLQLAAQRQPHPGATWSCDGGDVPANSVDIVYTSGVFHHIPPAQRQDELTRIWDWLRPGGLLALFENNPWNPGTRWVMSQIAFDRDAICLTPGESRQRLRQARFTVEGSDFLFFFPRLLSVARPLEQYLTSIPFGAQYVLWGRKGS
jgi:SAM-dependent methyltransferase